MKVAVVGGGSTYTPELVDGFARLPFAVDEVVLIDPAVSRLGVVGEFGRRIVARYGSAVRLTWTDDLDAGLTDADVVLLQLRVGGQETRISDETFPLECGCVGQETTGAGGLAKALRTVPVVLDIARAARRRAAPDAWVIAFTNPVGIVTRALLDDGHRALGLCNVAIGVQRSLAGLLDVTPDAVTLDHVGLNHLTWARAATVNGVDRLPELIAKHGDDLAEPLGLPAELLRLSGTLPSYYLRYFYAHDSVVAEERTSKPRGARVAEIERELLDLYRDPALDEKPELLTQRGGAYYSEAAIGLLASLHGSPGRHAVNVRNDGTLPNLPSDAVVEVMCDVSAGGAVPVPTTPLAPDHAGLVSHVSAYEELAVDAALRGGADRVFRALLAHPLVGQADQARGLTDRLLAANSEFLAWAR
ncbi:6-phospho-beta-glucosidase [Actinophytocola oryzae]|uniref:6-phospho-beta-glucosidase n=1 Tax=Actinophytocola oryzae TaxID=502181 RepID=A0A4R7UYX8_9PSEU|nr:6-phospho-beta-glucosidase [Actinophytocola oryzae]TDV41740.1 6-phospho-beta-glucosidase [Actinophytocola oryzae]